MSKNSLPNYRLLSTVDDCNKALEEIRVKWETLKNSRNVPYKEFIDNKFKNLELLIKKNKNPLWTPVIAMPLANEFFRIFLKYDMKLINILNFSQSSDKIRIFIEYQNQMSDEEYWKYLGHSYISQDFFSVPNNILTKLFQSDRPGREYLMSEKDREDFDQLPDEITIYRAMSKKEYDSGNYRYSWTLNKKVAELFLNRNEALYKKDMLIHEIKIKKIESIAYFNNRNEEEIIYIKG